MPKQRPETGRNPFVFRGFRRPRGRSRVVAKSRRPIVEQLEGRVVRAVFGLPWMDPTHLTLSFAPDGTSIVGAQSDLFQTLDSEFPTSASWQDLIVQAFQTWATQTNVSIGLTTDSGAPFGVAGLSQGDPRFGDIRIGAIPLASDVMAITVPPDPYFSGTLSGDMILNSSANLTPGDLFAVAQHEAGLCLGLGESTDPTSAMYSFLNPQATLSPGDIQNIQALYGTPDPDPNASNSSFATAAPISEPILYIGQTPLVAYGDHATASNTDFFSVSPPALYAGSVTIQLQTSGISFLQPQLDVCDQNGNLLGQAQSTSEVGDVVSVTLPQVNPFQRYYIEVSSPAQNVFGIGRYALSVTFNGRSLINPSSLPGILSGPYDSLSAGDLAGLLTNPAGVLFNSNLHTNGTIPTAEPLQPEPGYPTNSRYVTVASLGDLPDVEFYRIQAPRAPAGQTDVLTVGLTAMPIDGIVPIATIYDAYGNPVSTQILLNGDGTYIVQATGLNPGAPYYLQVSAAPAPAPSVGNYSLVADFNGVPAQPLTFAAGTLSQSSPLAAYSLYIPQTELFQFVLSAGDAGTPTNAQVQLEIYNSTGQLVFSLAGGVGNTVSGASVLLTPGEYQVLVSAANAGGAAWPTISFSLRGANLSDPIGPTPSDPTNEPMYPCPNDPSVYCYCYPDGTYSTTPYEFSSTD
jgi:Matrixin